MKKCLSGLLAAILLFGILTAGCSEKPQAGCNAPVDPYAALRDENMPNKLLNSDVTNFPMASDATTYAQRRQLCLDFFQLQLDFQWRPNMDIPDYLSYYFGYAKELRTDTLYAGIPYMGLGSGNIYRWLEYYDETTGIFDLETALADNGGYGENGYVDGYYKDAKGNVICTRYRSMMTLFNQCSSSPGWAWGRVINSAQFGMTKDTNVYNGYIPVGCYTYGYEHDGIFYDTTTIDVFGEKTEKNPTGYDVADVIRDLCAEKGENALYECYAQMKPGDCLVSAGHQLMVKDVKIYTGRDGQIDYGFSTVTVMEQIDAWGLQDELKGQPFVQQGWTNKTYMFSALQEEHYIPFTFAELLDPNDPQDKKHLDYYNSYADKLTAVEDRYSAIACSAEMNGTGVEPAQIYSTLGKTEGSISYAEFTQASFAANYAVSDVFVTVTDSSGKVLLSNIYRAVDCYQEREVAMTAARSTCDLDENGAPATLCTGLESLATGENTLTVTLQLSTGEKLTAYSGTLTN